MKKNLIILLTLLVVVTGCSFKKDKPVNNPDKPAPVVNEYEGLTVEREEYKEFSFDKVVKGNTIQMGVVYTIAKYKDSNDFFKFYEIEYDLYLNGAIVGDDFNDYDKGITTMNLILNRKSNINNVQDFKVDYSYVDSKINEFNNYIKNNTAAVEKDNGYLLIPVYINKESEIGETKLLAADNEGRVFGGITIRNNSEKVENINSERYTFNFSSIGDSNDTFLIDKDGYKVVSCHAPKGITETKDAVYKAYEYTVTTYNNSIFVEDVKYAKANCK